MAFPRERDRSHARPHARSGSGLELEGPVVVHGPVTIDEGVTVAGVDVLATVAALKARVDELERRLAGGA